MRTSSDRSKSTAKPGFTLVEVLVVVVIIAIVVSIIAGVSKWVYEDSNKKRTVAWMRITMAAIDTYQRTTHIKLDSCASNGGTPPGVFSPFDADDMHSMLDGHLLYVNLMACQASADVLNQLPAEAFYRKTNWDCFKDAWGGLIDYRTLGPSGSYQCILVSPGPDGRIGASDTSGGIPPTAFDNISSDQF